MGKVKERELERQEERWEAWEELEAGVSKSPYTRDEAVEPPHYTEMNMSPLDYITENEGEFTWCISNVIKYVSRYQRKNGVEDLKKARWYLDYQIQLEESK